MGINVHIIALIAAYLLDKVLGDPRWLPHPVIWFGNMVSFFEKRLNRGNRRILKGAFTVFFLIAIVFAFFSLLIYYAYSFQIIVGLFFETLFLFFGLAGTTLIKEGKAVFEKLKISLDDGRKQVSRIVGRDTSQLSADQVKAATLETLAENLSDGVVAPLFWYFVAGIPGMMVYKMVNTLDSMIGYKNERYYLFGRFAARIDDLANYIPARLTAILMVVCSGSSRAFSFIFRYGRAHSSPNAGYPEAALAGILNARFGGPNSYFGKIVEKPFIGKNYRSFTDNDLNKSVRINRLVEGCMVLIMVILTYLSVCPVFFSII